MFEPFVNSSSRDVESLQQSIEKLFEEKPDTYSEEQQQLFHPIS